MTDIEARLTNWGRWSRASAPNKPNTASPLYHLIRENNPEVTSETQVKTVDEADAWIIEKAIMRVCLKYQRQILKLQFISGQRPGVICRKVGLEPHTFERELQAIERKIEVEISPVKAYNEGNLDEST